jgi:hypothetical protein
MKGQHFFLVATSISVLLPSAQVMVSASGFSSWWDNHSVPSLRGNSGNNTNATETDPEQDEVLPPDSQQDTQPPCTTPADFCLMDMSECPDGSLVARDPQLCCDFRPCPGEGSDTGDSDTSSTPVLDWLDQVFGSGRRTSQAP